ncbi:uncharacterized protein I303_105054 [Kwoniella dejecticola CBS 10117]|uniref:Ubiquitin-conjugating enzyme 4 n=1 Tax=Kwoniella dejecticola CBS 10117 TaxID=1296121 RepID=A0A1A6A3K7_9TREE|nr:ubiquitin-conjugating enzyme 4 [Kwoniella dejecticola CBS 10117]OBR84641.1 ubiquitin-conjugating enzyme 4 [Kwoniella dejecticola CBS 10117]
MPPRIGTASAPGMASKRIKKEISDLSKENLGSIVLTPNESNIFQWKAVLPGPAGSPYEGGLFEVEITIPEDYPFSPPKLHFITKVYHCNIASTGAICLDLLKHAWSPALSLYKVILSLSSLLTDPNPADPLVPQIAQEYKRDRKKHDATAREWVKKYALPKTAAPTTASAPPTKSTTSTSRPKLLNRPSSHASTSSNTTQPQLQAHPPMPIAGTRRPASSRDPIDLASDSEDDDRDHVDVERMVNGSRSTNGDGYVTSMSTNSNMNGSGSGTGTGTHASANGERRTKRSRLNGPGGGGGGNSAGDAIVIDE